MSFCYHIIVTVFTLYFVFGHDKEFDSDVDKFGDFLKNFAEESLGTKYLQVSNLQLSYFATLILVLVIL